MLKRLVLGSVLVALCGLASVRQAKADDIDTFTFTTTSNNVTNVYVWQILPSPTDVTVDPVMLNNFEVVGVPFTVNGVTPTGTLGSPATIDFYLGSAGGGFVFNAGSAITIDFNTIGPQLFTIPAVVPPETLAEALASPTFINIPVDAPVTLDDYTSGLPVGTLSIVATPIPVVGTPEPSSLLLTGLGLIALLGLAWKKQLLVPFRRVEAGSEA